MAGQKKTLASNMRDFAINPCSINQSINKLYLSSNLQCSTQVLISSSQLQLLRLPMRHKQFSVRLFFGVFFGKVCSNVLHLYIKRFEAFSVKPLLSPSSLISPPSESQIF